MRLKWHVVMFSWNIVQFLCSQHFEVITDVSTCLTWVYDIINKSSLSTNHWVGKPGRVFKSMLFQILCRFMRNNEMKVLDQVFKKVKSQQHKQHAGGHIFVLKETINNGHTHHKFFRIPIDIANSILTSP